MRILLLCHSFNSLSQRLFVELSAIGHDVSVEYDINDSVTAEAVALFAPDVIVAPFLKRAIPASVWCRHICLVVHPGPVGDGGPSALDWAILDDAQEWGVTVLQATGEIDAGPVWAHRRFAMRPGTKSSLYRGEVTEAATSAVLEAVEAVAAGNRQPQPLASLHGVQRLWRGSVKQHERAIDWQTDCTETVLRKIASADGMPGVCDELFGREVYLYDAHPADGFEGAPPGNILARCGVAVARATTDGAVWIGHVKLAGKASAVKLPATTVFADEAAQLRIAPGYRDIWYEEADDVGYLYFQFYNGAMGTQACRRLLQAYRLAVARPTKAVVLMGGREYWSNGLNLNLIEAAPSAADESWLNINVMDDLAEAIVRTTGRLVISAMNGNAGAGGAFLARAADQVWLRDGVVLNPHYKDMGNLYGSELWTYLLPRYAGEENARHITQARLPMGAAEALELGLADHILSVTRDDFDGCVRHRASNMGASQELHHLVQAKAERRAQDEAVKPLAAYRSEELEHMKRNFYGFDPSYHIARYNFVHKVAKSRTPLTIARHRSGPRQFPPSSRAAS